MQYKADKSRGLLRVLKNFNGCKCKGCGQMGHLALKNSFLCPRRADVSTPFGTIETALAEVFALGVRPEGVDQKCTNLLCEMDRRLALTALDQVKLKAFLQSHMPHLTCCHVTCRTWHVACHMLHVTCCISISHCYMLACPTCLQFKDALTNGEHIRNKSAFLMRILRITQPNAAKTQKQGLPAAFTLAGQQTSDVKPSEPAQPTIVTCDVPSTVRPMTTTSAAFDAAADGATSATSERDAHRNERPKEQEKHISERPRDLMALLRKMNGGKCKACGQWGHMHQKRSDGIYCPKDGTKHVAEHVAEHPTFCRICQRSDGGHRVADSDGSMFDGSIVWRQPGHKDQKAKMAACIQHTLQDLFPGGIEHDCLEYLVRMHADAAKQALREHKEAIGRAALRDEESDAAVEHRGRTAEESDAAAEHDVLDVEVARVGQEKPHEDGLADAAAAVVDAEACV